MNDPDLTFSVTGEPLVAELEEIGAGLTAFNEADVGPAGRDLLDHLGRAGDRAERDRHADAAAELAREIG